MVKHTQRICRLLSTNFLSVLDHFILFQLKGLIEKRDKIILVCWYHVVIRIHYELLVYFFIYQRRCQIMSVPTSNKNRNYCCTWSQLRYFLIDVFLYILPIRKIVYITLFKSTPPPKATKTVKNLKFQTIRETCRASATS